MAIGSAAATAVVISHSHAEGTLVSGTSKGDGSAEILKANRFRWFPSIKLWGIAQSRDHLAKRWQIGQAAEQLRAAGFEVTVEIDEDDRRSFAEAEAERYKRAEDRAAYHTDVAGSAAAKSAAAWQAEHGILDMIPAGQPILVGHHSEGRHRRDLARADSLRRKGRDEQERAEYHEDRAEAAERFRERRESIPTTLRRIEKLEAEERSWQRALDGKRDGHTMLTNEGGYKPAEGAYRERVEAELADLREQFAYWRNHVKQAEESGVKVWTRGDFAKGDFARRRGQWVEVLRVNAKSLTVPAWLDMRPVAMKDGQQYTWTDTLPYDKVSGRKSADEMAAILADAERLGEIAS